MIRHHSSVCRCGIADFIVSVNSAIRGRMNGMLFCSFLKRDYAPKEHDMILFNIPFGTK